MVITLLFLLVALILLALDRGKQRPPNARSPFRAGAASLIQVGFGQLYNGELRKAILFWITRTAPVLLAAVVGILHHFWGWIIFTAVVPFGILGVALVDAIRTARARESYTAKAVNRWYVYVGALVVAGLVSQSVHHFLGIRAFKIPAESMSPSLEVGDYIIARLETSESYEDHRGDVIVFKYPRANETTMIKRVVALPGETIEIQGAEILINGQSISDPWARTMEQSLENRGTRFGPYTVPEETLFLMGDNAANSADSRTWGPLPRENIVGVAEFIYLSLDSETHRVRLNRIGTNL